MSSEHPEPEPSSEVLAGGNDDVRRGAGRRRRPGALVAAAVAVGVMLTGGGVAYLASGAGDGGGSGDSAPGEDPPPLRIDGHRAESAARDAGALLRAVGDLPDGPDSAPVYTAKDRVAAADVARLAKALGVEGKPRMEGGSWRVGVSRDGQGPLLQVQPGAPGSWTFHRYGAGGGCAVSAPAKPDPADGPDGSVSSTAVECTAVDGGPGAAAEGSGSTAEGSGSAAEGSGDPVSKSAAKAAAAPVLKALGQRDAAVDASGSFGAIRTVSVDPVVGGLPTQGWQTTLQVGSDRQLTGGSGYLARPAEGATYPVISAEDALKALNEGRGGARQELSTARDCASAVPHEDGTGPKRSVAGEPGCTGKAEPRKVRGAEFGLAAQSVAGRPTLVPSWLFEVAGEAPTTFAGGMPGKIVWPQIAVHPDYIEHVRPSDASTPEPGAPGSGAGSGTASGSGSDPGAGEQPGSPGEETPAEPAPAPSGSVPPDQQPGERPQKADAYPMGVESYSVSGRKLTLHFWGGVCSDYSATAEESGDAVKVQVTGVDKEPGQVCVKMAKRFTETVELESPLDGRKVMDAGSGRTVSAK